VTFQVDVELDLVLAVFIRLMEEHPVRCTSSVSGDSSLCHYGKEGSHLFGSDESLPGVFAL